MFERLLRRRPRKRALLLVIGALALYFAIRCLQDTPSLYSNEGMLIEEERWETPLRNVTKRELVLLQMIFRHGHRAPFNLYPTDEHDESFWKEGMGQLTQLGRLQHYVMGDYLLKWYQDFITQDPNEADLLTADSGRCQYGAYTFMAGLYPPLPENAFTDELLWQPIISRHYFDKENRWVLSRRKCPVAAREEDEYKLSREADEIRSKYQPFYDFWTEHSGRNIKDWTRAADLGKTMACERDYNLSVPDWGLQYWSCKLDFLTTGTLGLDLFRGPLIGYLVSKLKQKINGHIPEKKTLVYSAHGSNLACLLLAIEQYNFRAPPHAATIVIELWEEEGPGFGWGHSVRWLYFNSSSPERRMDAPFVLRPKGCPADDFCPFEIFEETVRDLIPHDWVKECMDFSQRARFPPPTYRFLSSSPEMSSSFLMLCIVFILTSIIKSFL